LNAREARATEHEVLWCGFPTALRNVRSVGADWTFSCLRAHLYLLLFCVAALADGDRASNTPDRILEYYCLFSETCDKFRISFFRKRFQPRLEFSSQPGTRFRTASIFSSRRSFANFERPETSRPSLQMPTSRCSTSSLLFSANPKRDSDQPARSSSALSRCILTTGVPAFGLFTRLKVLETAVIVEPSYRSMRATIRR